MGYLYHLKAFSLPSLPEFEAVEVRQVNVTRNILRRMSDYVSLSPSSGLRGQGYKYAAFISATNSISLLVAGLLSFTSNPTLAGLASLIYYHVAQYPSNAGHCITR